VTSIDGENSGFLKPLGIFGVIASGLDFEQLRDQMYEIVDQIPKQERPKIAEYLQAGAIVFAIMEVTTDVLEGRFAHVVGGSSVLTDGRYYWRRDTAAYVQHYGVSLPEEFLANGKRRNWMPPVVEPEDVLRFDSFLMKSGARLRRRPPSQNGLS